jgi:hypothetical protein
MKKTVGIYFLIFITMLCSDICMAVLHYSGVPKLKSVIPLGGNAWVNGAAVIGDEGLTNWTDQQSVTSIYFRVSVVQDLQLALRLRVPVGQSIMRISAGSSVIDRKINNTAFDTISIGKIHITHAGYIKVELHGLNKTGAVYADVSDLIVQTDKPDTDMVYVKSGSSYHFGRRGPSVHLRYSVPENAKKTVKWFYNEITVPKGMDVVGSYFMADGFGEGYFGMQVNSATERRVLFSVWSPYKTEDPKSIPDSMQIKLVKKGDNVHTGEFGNEGSGGQSYMLYPWEAGKTYAFLLSADPDPVKKSTTFTAYFKDIAAGKWYLVASFNRPQTVTYLTDLYSFLENFEPDNGNKIRKAFYTNQWIGSNDNQWQELTNSVYTGDATAKMNFRKDYAGGLDNGQFYLKNGGFFDGYVPLKQSFNRVPNGAKPIINIKALPVK